MRQGLTQPRDAPQGGRWQSIAPERRRIVLWGAADQCRVNRYILESLGCEIAALVDDTPAHRPPYADVPFFNGWPGFAAWLGAQDRRTLGFVVAIGNPYGHVRCRLHDRLTEAGLAAVSFADPTALLCRSATLGPGLQVMAAAIVHNEAAIGRQCLLNTRSLVEHDCVLGEGVEIGPGAVLCGRVEVGRNTWIGAGAVIRQRVKIGSNVIIGAGAVVVADIPDNVVAIGVAARPIPGRTTPSAEAANEV